MRYHAGACERTRRERALEFTVPKQQAELSNGVVRNLGGRPGRRLPAVLFQVREGLRPGGLEPQRRDPVRPGARRARFDSRGARRRPKQVHRELRELARRRRHGIARRAQCLLLPPRAALRVRGPLSSLRARCCPTRRGRRTSGLTSSPGPTLSPSSGRWYCFELMVRANTAGQRDGRIACWLDGKLIADFPEPQAAGRRHAEDQLRLAVPAHRSNTVRENKKWYDEWSSPPPISGPSL